MRQTYSQAEKVIVIDKDILASGGSMAQRQRTVRVSDWMLRLWTFQEACLSKQNLVFAFRDKAVTLQELDCEDSTTHSYEKVFVQRARSRLFSDRIPDPRRMSNVNLLLHSASTLHRRETTKAEDEAICLATLLDIDVAELPQKPCLVDLLKHMKTVPGALMFAPGARSIVKGYQWAPASFLAQGNRSYIADPETPYEATPTLQGLRVERNILSIEGDLIFRTKKDISWADHPHAYISPRERHVLATGSEGESLYVLDLVDDQLEGREEELTFEFSNAVVVFEYPYKDVETSSGILLTEVRNISGTLYGHWTIRLVVASMKSYEKIYDTHLPSDRCVGKFERSRLLCID